MKINWYFILLTVFVWYIINRLTVAFIVLVSRALRFV